MCHGSAAHRLFSTRQFRDFGPPAALNRRSPEMPSATTRPRSRILEAGVGEPHVRCEREVDVDGAAIGGNEDRRAIVPNAVRVRLRGHQQAERGRDHDRERQPTKPSQETRVDRIAHHRSIAGQQKHDQDKRRSEDSVDDGRGKEQLDRIQTRVFSATPSVTATARTR